MFHHDVQNTGVTSATPPMNTNQRLNFFTEGEMRSSPAIVNNRAYVGCDDTMFYCIDLTSGEEVWSTSLEETITSSPAIVGSYAYIGSKYAFYCINIENGEIEWQYAIGDFWIMGNPVVENSYVYLTIMFDSQGRVTSWYPSRENF